jgi:hypothetical protein
MKKAIKIFFSGILAALGALILEAFLFVFFPYQTGATEKIGIFFLLSILIEEFVKFSIMAKIWKNTRYQSKAGIIIFSFFFGIGFALTEIILNIWGQNQNKQPIFSYMGLFLLHFSTIFMFGYFLFFRQKISTPKNLSILALGFLIHFSFNLAILKDISNQIIYSTLLIFIFILLIKSFFKPNLLNKES